MATVARTFIHAQGTQMIDGTGRPIRLRGVNLGGMLNMEHFVTGFVGTESLMRQAVRETLGEDRYRRFFDRLLDVFFTEEDAAFLESCGINSIRIGFNYRHFEDDLEPFVLKPEGLARLDRVVELCAKHNIAAILDFHALPGGQNAGWHSDNPTHIALLWKYRHFQDRVVWLWVQIADHYKDNVWVAGYNLLNEPADDTGEAVGPFYERLVAAVRAVDPHHMLFVDGNRYATEFDFFGEPWPNTVYTCHDYAVAGLRRDGVYPGTTEGQWFDKTTIEEKFLSRTEYARSTGTPLYVGEFAPIYTGDEARDAELFRLLDDQLEIYRRHGSGWCTWMYKDVGRQGLTSVTADSPYRRRFGDFITRKQRLATDAWGQDYSQVQSVVGPVVDLVNREFHEYEGYPWGNEYWVHTLVPHIAFSQPMVRQYAELFRGLDDSALDDLADSFGFANCAVREGLRERLTADTALD